jgi:hypothetical protein
MGFVVYNARTKRQVRAFDNERSAKISCAAWNRTWKRKGETFAVMDANEFDYKFNKWTTVTSLVGGKEVRIREQDVGTCCDPSTETYWSM